MIEITFEVFGSSQTAGSKRAGVSKSGKLFVRDDNPKGKGWKEHVATVAGEVMAGRELFRGPIKAEFIFWIPRPKGHFGKRGLLPSAPAFHVVKPDVLKLARAVEDALSGVVYGDDRQIVVESLRKEYGEPARVWIRIREATSHAA